jgi:hypothetical protein
MRTARTAGYETILAIGEAVPDDRAYANLLGLDVSQVGTIADLSGVALDVPLIIVTDETGAISRTWPGIVRRQEEGEIINSLAPGLQSASEVDARDVTPEALHQLIQGTSAVVVVDVRPRSEFAWGHINNAINIPADELSARVPVELPPPADSSVVVYCHHCNSCEVLRPDVPLVDCSRSARAFGRLGFHRVYMLSAALDGVVTAGIAVEGQLKDLPAQAERFGNARDR